MTALRRSTGTYTFGRFRLDPVRRCLTRNGRPIDLSSRIFDTLLYLVENPNRLIGKDELLNAVWYDRFVGQANLCQTIFVLRKALREAGEEKNLIATISGRGYRLATAVLEVEGRPLAGEGSRMMSLAVDPIIARASNEDRCRAESRSEMATA